MAGGTGDRGISEAVGLVLVLLLLVVLLSFYQVYAVPTQNARVEFTHDYQVNEDLVHARNAIIETKRTGQSTSAAVELGTVYPTRLFAINPPAPAGTLRTTPNGTIRVLNRAGSEVDVCPVTNRTRMLEYEAAYNQFESAPTYRYENTVLYANYSSDVRLRTGQKLVEGRTVNLIPIIGEYRVSGTRTVAFEPRAGRLEDTVVNDPTVMVPTRLSNASWVELLGEEVEPGNVAVAGGTLELSLSGTYTISCGPVAINALPPGGERVVSGVDINPAGPGTVELRSAVIDQNDDTLVYTQFNNTASEPINVTSARIAFFYDDQTSGGKTVDYADLYDGSPAPANLVGNLSVLGATAELSRPVTLASSTDHQLTFDFDEGVTTRDFFVVKLVFDTGESGTYFIGIETTGSAPTATATPTPTPVPGNQPPVADFTFTDLGGNSYDLDGTISYDPDGTIQSYAWDLDGDGTAESNNSTVTGVKLTGNTAVTLTVTDDGGATNSTTKAVP